MTTSVSGVFRMGHPCPTKKLGIMPRPHQKTMGPVPLTDAATRREQIGGRFARPLCGRVIYKQWYSPSVAAGVKGADSDKARRGEAGMPSLTAGQGCPVWQPGSGILSGGNLPQAGKTVGCPFSASSFWASKKMKAPGGAKPSGFKGFNCWSALKDVVRFEPKPT